MTRTFDHRDPGVPAGGWKAEMSRATPLRLPGSGSRVVVVAAHPDDETLGAGGLLTAAADAGAQVSVVVATDGGGPDAGPALMRRRRVETQDAVEVLSPQAVLTFLGLPDTELAEVEEALEAMLRPLLADADLVVSTWRADGHGDHEALARAVRSVLRRSRREVAHWQYPVWAWHWGDPGQPPWPGLHRLTLTAGQQERKRSAIACYPSQTTGEEPVVPASLLAHLDTAGESFVVEGVHPAGDPRVLQRPLRALRGPVGAVHPLLRAAPP